ncbi:TPA: hypothetical protein U5E33_003309 [Yersinia enterocolitica]|nr:hypothetical protein [Yersinia enterocolitica]HEN3570282.1 hypothetical protein [Yersinia enterocolitica]HEN3574294.1 hypothetical protein [Yersinia enterocolitica]HEN3628838.1 hypothetical protein [Yersinia enterocolitica]HEN3649072.1 hypothetical protein [Yersinia enterocolitica]
MWDQNSQQGDQPPDRRKTSRYADFMLLEKKFQITLFGNFVLCDVSQVPARRKGKNQKKPDSPRNAIISLQRKNTTPQISC